MRPSWKFIFHFVLRWWWVWWTSTELQGNVSFSHKMEEDNKGSFGRWMCLVPKKVTRTHHLENFAREVFASLMPNVEKNLPIFLARKMSPLLLLARFFIYLASNHTAVWMPTINPLQDQWKRTWKNFKIPRWSCGSRMLVSRIKPCRCQYKPNLWRDCEWLIITVIIYTMFSFTWITLVMLELLHARFKIFLEHAIISDTTLVCSFVDIQVMLNHDNFVYW